MPPPTNSPSNLRDPITPPLPSPHEQSPRQRPVTPPALTYLSSPVPDLASTLYTLAADNADDANVSFLRDSLDTLEQEPVIGRPSSHSDRQRDPRRSIARAREAENIRVSGSSREAQAAEDRREQEENLDDLSRRERLQRVLARLNRIHEPAGSSVAAYSNRTPSPNRQRLYDWAPSYDELGSQDNEIEQILADLRRQQPDTHPDILRILSQSQLETSRQQDNDQATRSAASESTDPVDRRDRLRERRRRETEWASLRSRAVLQRARQESSPSATERMLRYVMDRERSGMSEEEERARGSGWFSTNTNRVENEQPHRNPSSTLPPSLTAGELRARTMQERTDAMQRRYNTEPTASRLPRISTPPVPATSAPVSSPSQLLENALRYLNQLRACSQYDEALSAATDHGFAKVEFFADKHDDFLLGFEEIEPLAESSWLQPGTVFGGYQHATATNAGLLQTRPQGSSAHTVEQINPNFRDQPGTTTGFDHPPGSTRIQTFSANSPWLSHQFEAPVSHSLTQSGANKATDLLYDNWPVRVIIHNLDTARMTLQGTMEAYDVPQHPASLSILNSSNRPKAGKKHAPITTYLEGHIIDLATHSFLTPASASDTKRSSGVGSQQAHRTEPQAATAAAAAPSPALPETISFPAATAHTDASNWRKLPPFNTWPSDDATARCLLSKSETNKILHEYIFMRWKERCFVHSKDDKCSAGERGGDQDRGHGLTISGFYYVSLRRCDGQVEGLYFDPMSTPYQYLRLKGQGTGWPAVEFR